MANKNKKKSSEKIRVHNQGKREYTAPPSEKGGKKRMLLPGRAIELEETLALKMIESYPRDLVEFDSLVSGKKKNLGKENARLESENGSYLEKIEKLESDNQLMKDKIVKLGDPEYSKENENQKVMILSLKKEIEELKKPENSKPEAKEKTETSTETDQNKKD